MEREKDETEENTGRSKEEKVVRKKKREDEFSGFSLNVSGLHCCPPHPISPRL